MRLGVGPIFGWKWKWSNGVKKVEMNLFWYISMKQTSTLPNRVVWSWCLIMRECFYAFWICSRTKDFTIVWLWPAITPVQNLSTALCYTLSESPGWQLSHGLTLDMCCHIKIKSNLPKSKKIGPFQHFLCCSPKKLSSRQSENIDASGLSNT